MKSWEYVETSDREKLSEQRFASLSPSNGPFFMIERVFDILPLSLRPHQHFLLIYIYIYIYIYLKLLIYIYTWCIQIKKLKLKKEYKK